jgi:hypothetical protein
MLSWLYEMSIIFPVNGLRLFNLPVRSVLLIKGSFITAFEGLLNYCSYRIFKKYARFENKKNQRSACHPITLKILPSSVS